jgi:hypothetical protein
MSAYGIPPEDLINNLMQHSLFSANTSALHGMIVKLDRSADSPHETYNSQDYQRNCGNNKIASKIDSYYFINRRGLILTTLLISVLDLKMRSPSEASFWS